METIVLATTTFSLGVTAQYLLSIATAGEAGKLLLLTFFSNVSFMGQLLFAVRLMIATNGSSSQIKMVDSINSLIILLSGSI
jgi:hypothetical protein